MIPHTEQEIRLYAPQYYISIYQLINCATRSISLGKSVDLDRRLLSRHFKTDFGYAP